MDGLQLLQTIRADAAMASLPVLMVTAEAKKKTSLLPLRQVQAAMSLSRLRPPRLKRSWAKFFEKLGM